MRMGLALQTCLAEPSGVEAWIRPAIAGNSPDTLLTSLSKARKKNSPEMAFYLGALLQAQNRPQEAIGYYRKALALGLNQAEVHSNMGLAFADVGQLDNAIASLTRSLSIQPNSIHALHNLGVALQRAGRFNEARTAYNCVLALQPDHVVVLANLGEVLRLMGEPDEAETCYRYALLQQPDHAGLLLNLGILLQSQMRFDEAESCYRQILAANPENPMAHNNLGVLLQAQGRWAEAETSLRQALAAAPENPDAHNNLGIVLFAKGHLAEAGASYQRALTFRPDFAKAYLHYVQARKISDEDRSLIAHLESLAAEPGLGADEKSDVHFALGKCYDDLGKYEQAFGHFENGHELKRHRYFFNPEQHIREIDNLIETFDKEFFEHRAALGSPSDIPVFIVGMPRSGTTLVEQIISSHPQVFGAGELDFLDMQRKRFSLEQIGQLGPQDIISVADEYIAHLRAFSPEALHITDKMPQNYFHLGLIRLCLPNARIIHCKRNPLDTCLSIYSQKFTADHPYAHDLGWLAAYYEQYQRLMRHWREMFPGQMLDVQYEELVHNQDTVTRKILEFCNIEWDDKCLAFNRNERIINTASSWQVRQPMYASSIDRWKRYQPFLGELLRLERH